MGVLTCIMNLPQALPLVPLCSREQLCLRYQVCLHQFNDHLFHSLAGNKGKINEVLYLNLSFRCSLPFECVCKYYCKTCHLFMKCFSLCRASISEKKTHKFSRQAVLEVSKQFIFQLLTKYNFLGCLCDAWTHSIFSSGVWLLEQNFNGKREGRSYRSLSSLPLSLWGITDQR